MSEDEVKNERRGRRASDRRRENAPSGDFAESEDPTIAKAFGDDTRRALARPKDETRLHAPNLPPSAVAKEAEEDPSLVGAISQLRSNDVDKTVVLPQEPPTFKPGARLVLIKGDKVGARLDLPKSPFLVGRSQNADLTLNEATLSRAHFALWFDDADNVWSLEDLGSTSGTLVNGRVADEEIELRPGDVIAVGKIELRFFATEQLPEIIPDAETHVTRITRIAKGVDVVAEERKVAARKRRRRLIRLAAVAFSLLFVVGAGAAALYFSTRDPAKATARTREADALVEKAMVALNNKDLKSARDFAEAAVALSPSHRSAQSALRMVAGEEAAFAALTAAKKALDDEDPESADRQLRKIADTSRYAKERNQMRARIRKTALQIEIARVEQLIVAGDAQSAREGIEALAKRYPEATSLLAPLRDRLAALVREQRKPPKLLRRAAKAFSVGNTGQALLYAKKQAAAGDESAQAFLNRLADFERVYDQGKKALAQKQGTPASRLLEEARALSVALSGGRPSSMTRKVSRPLADALFLVATTDFARGRKCAGAAKVLRGLRLAPGASALQKKAKDLEFEAERALVRAQASTSSDRKRQLAEDALCLVSKRSRLYKDLREMAK